MSHRPGKHPRITRDELDRLFDREMDGASRRDLVGRLGRDPAAADEVNDIRGIVHSMRLRPDESPDMTASVLARLDDEQGFFSRRVRRQIKAGRLAAAACLLLGLLGLAVSQRLAPDAFKLREEATPVADLGESVRQDSAESGQRFADAVRGLTAAQRADRLLDSQSAGARDIAAPARGADRPAVIGTISSDDEPGLAVPVAHQYIALTLSADAEVLALADGSSGGAITLRAVASLAGEGFAGDGADARVWTVAAASLAGEPSLGTAVGSDIWTGFGNAQMFGPQLAFAGGGQGGFYDGLNGVHFASAGLIDPWSRGGWPRGGWSLDERNRSGAAGFQIEPGLVPMSVMGGARPAYVGSRDPLGDAIRAHDAGPEFGGVGGVPDDR